MRSLRITPQAYMSIMGLNGGSVCGICTITQLITPSKIVVGD